MSGKKADGRLLFVRNIEAADAGRSGRVYEFELVADVPAHGAFHAGPMWIRPWDFAESAIGRRHSLILSIQDLLGEPGNHVRGPPQEICAFASVVLRRRIALGPLVRRDDKPMRVAVVGTAQSPQLLEGKIGLADLAPAVDRLRALPEHLHEAFLLSCRFYQEALELLDTKPDVAYLLLVSAIEVFIAKLGLRQAEEDFAVNIKDALLAVPEPHRAVLVKRLLEVDRGIQKNFVKFMLDYITPAFWERSSKHLSPADGRIEEHEIGDLMIRVYSQRSQMVHAGEPLPPNIVNPPETAAEIDRSAEVSALGRRWTQAEYLPYVRFFERLVQHVLVAFLERQTGGAATPGA
jgi:hypothetical protein